MNKEIRDDLVLAQKERDEERAREFCQCLGNGKTIYQVEQEDFLEEFVNE